MRKSVQQNADPARVEKPGQRPVAKSAELVPPQADRVLTQSIQRAAPGAAGCGHALTHFWPMPAATERPARLGWRRGRESARPRRARHRSAAPPGPNARMAVQEWREAAER